MQYSRFGQTGMTVSRICLGCMSFGQPGGPTHPWALDEDASRPILRKAVEAGINFFDTANHYNYGASEEITGRALKDFARRDEIVIATKVGLKMGDRPNQRGLSRRHILSEIDRSLERLSMDHVDILYIHRLDPLTPDEEMLSALDHVVRSGKARYVAASSMWAWQFAKLREMQKAAGFQQFIAMQNHYNLVYREEEREMIPYCASQGVAVVPWSPIARGFLAGNRSAGGTGTERARTDPLNQRYGSKADLAILAKVERVAERLGRSPAEIAYAWVLSKPFVAAPIAGVTRPGQLDAAIAAVDLKLDAATVKSLEAAYRPRAVLGHS